VGENQGGERTAMSGLMWGVAFGTWTLFAVVVTALLVSNPVEDEQPKPEHYADRWDTEQNNE
jgi:hypothetical protein